MAAVVAAVVAAAGAAATAANSAKGNHTGVLLIYVMSVRAGVRCQHIYSQSGRPLKTHVETERAAAGCEARTNVFCSSIKRWLHMDLESQIWKRWVTNRYVAKQSGGPLNKPKRAAAKKQNLMAAC